jgi:hypothetical protein
MEKLMGDFDEVVVVIRENGSLVSLDNANTAFFKELGKVTTRRASHIEPCSKVWRVVFHTLRYFFGDKGWMASFTRRWPCLWRVNLTPIGGPIIYRHYWDREGAIAAEVAWLNEHLE